MAIDPVLTTFRFVGFAIMGAGVLLLAREQRVTVKQGLPARPWFIALWVAAVLVGIAVQVVAILAV